MRDSRCERGYQKIICILYCTKFIVCTLDNSLAVTYFVLIAKALAPKSVSYLVKLCTSPSNLTGAIICHALDIITMVQAPIFSVQIL